jgi:hypothetical protein
MENNLIKIGNKYHKDIGQYVGRGSPLGNPFPMKNKEDRDRVCDEYEKWFNNHKEDIEVKKELDRLYDIYKDKGELTLLCFCTPKRCHAETIKKYLEHKYNEHKYNKGAGVNE